ncbi:hypothetical protein PG997_015313 [Apiospora hydei]|uniref:Uncharacterized protein n=1 Tax=Apiospora hydei TaxID=1337664 RepID=A0ABR1UQA3_9PEZI
MDRSVSFGITTVLLPGENASIVEEVMSIFVGNQFVSEQVLRTIGTLPPGENFFPSPIDGVTATTAATATGTGGHDHLFSTALLFYYPNEYTSYHRCFRSHQSSRPREFRPRCRSHRRDRDRVCRGRNAPRFRCRMALFKTEASPMATASVGIILSRKGRHAREACTHRHTGTPNSHNNSNIFQLDQFLLDARPDRELVAELRSLDRTVRRHVEEHYHKQLVQDDSNVNTEGLAQVLAKLGINNSINEDEDAQQQAPSATRLSSLALKPSTRFQALRHIIMRVAFGSTTLRSGSSISILPPFVAAFGRYLEESESEPGLQRGTSDGTRQGLDPDSITNQLTISTLLVFSTALTKWRQLSVYLLRHTQRSSTDQTRTPISPLTPSEDISTQQAQQLAVELNRFLAPFVAVAEDGDDDESDTLARYEQENDLREALVECATLGYVLFSQPAEYILLYSDGKKRVAAVEGGGGGSSVSREKIVVCPGLQRVRDEEGGGILRRRYSCARSWRQLSAILAPVI